MRRFLQFVIVAAALFSNVHWQWTPNGYLAAILAGLAAYLVTVFPFQLLAWARKLQARFSHQKLSDRVPPRATSLQHRRK